MPAGPSPSRPTRARCGVIPAALFSVTPREEKIWRIIAVAIITMALLIAAIPDHNDSAAGHHPGG